MPVFTFSAADKRGRVSKAKAFATSEMILERDLDREGMMLVKVHGSVETKTPVGSRLRVSRNDLIEMAYHLSVLCASGVPLIKGLEDFKDQNASSNLKRILEKVLEDVNNGRLLSEALARHPRAFSAFFVSLVKAGEASGRLDQVMTRYYKEMEWQTSIRSHLMQALVYPAFLFLALTGLVVLLLTFLLPRVMALFPEGGVELPLPTKILVVASDTLSDHWMLFAGAAAAIPMTLGLLRATTWGRYALDLAVMRIPCIGGVVRDIAVARFISTFNVLLASSVEIMETLKIASPASGNAVIARRGREISDRILQGSLLSEAFVRVKEFGSLVQNLIAVGEQAGRITESLDRVNAYYDTQIPRKVKKALAVMEPTVILLAGLSVGFVLVGTLLPIFNLYSAF